MRKNTTIDTFRILLILLVITVHSNGLIDKASLGSVDGFLYNIWSALTYFCIPFFYAISGYFTYSSKNDDMANTKRVSRILHLVKTLLFAELLYIAISACFVGLPSVLRGFTHKSDWLLFLSDADPIPTIFDSFMLYFLIVLIFVSIIDLAFTMIFKKQRDKMMLAVAIVAFLVTQVHGGLFANWHIASILTHYFGGGVNHILGGLIYFTIGYFVKKYFEKLVALNTVVILAVLVASCILFTFELKVTPYGITLPLILFVVMVLLAKFPSLFSKKVNFISNIGSKYTLYIYLFHPIILWALTVLLVPNGQHLGLALWIGWVLLVYLLTLALSATFIKVRDFICLHKWSQRRRKI